MKQGSEVRIGYISSYNAGTGKAKVFYPDRLGQVTQEMSIFAPFGISQIPMPDDQVLVLHLSNGQEAGLIIGKTVGTGAAMAAAGGDITIAGTAGSITLSDLIKIKNKVL